VEAAVAVVDRDLAALEELPDAADQLVDDRLLALLGDRPVEAGLAGVDAERRRVGDGPVDVRGLEELLGGDATDVEAGAADPALLDERDVEPGAGAVERGRIAAGAAADDDDVEVLGRGDHLQGCRGRMSLPDPTGARGAADRARAGAAHSTSTSCTVKATRMARPHSRAARMRRRVLIGAPFGMRAMSNRPFGPRRALSFWFARFARS
jgi:hypothetical protein